MKILWFQRSKAKETPEENLEIITFPFFADKVFVLIFVGNFRNNLKTVTQPILKCSAMTRVLQATGLKFLLTCVIEWQGQIRRQNFCDFTRKCLEKKWLVSFLIYVVKVQFWKFRFHISGFHRFYAFDFLFDLDAGEYVCPKTTVFGLKRDEVAALIDTGLRVHDKNPEMEGQEIETSGYNVSLLTRFEK